MRVGDEVEGWRDEQNEEEAEQERGRGGRERKVTERARVPTHPQGNG